MNRLGPTAVLLSMLVLGSAASISCDNATSPAASENPSSLTLEEKSIPPVFGNMELLRGRYRQTLHFKSSYWRLVFGSLPAQLETEFAELTVNSTLPAVPERLVAYKVIRPEVDEAYARSLAQRLGFIGEPEENKQLKYPDYRFYNGPPSDDSTPVLSIFKDGSISLWNNRLKNIPLNLPEDQECIDIAREWLDSHELYLEGVIDIEVSPSIMYVMQGRRESHYTYATSVSYVTGLDGCELFGMGAYFLIGENGKILEVHVNAPEFEPYSYVNVRTPESALDVFQDHLRNPSEFRADAPDCLISDIYRHISVNDVSLKYFAMLSPDGTNPAYAQPVYTLEGTGRNGPELPWERLSGAVDAVSRQ